MVWLVACASISLNLIRTSTSLEQKRERFISVLRLTVDSTLKPTKGTTLLCMLSSGTSTMNECSSPALLTGQLRCGTAPLRNQS